LPSVVLAKGIVGTFKDTGSSCIFSKGPRVGGASFNASLGGVVSKSTVGDRYIRRNVGIRTHQDTSLRHHISISKKIPRAILDTSSCVVISKLKRQTGILSTGRLAFPRHVVGPCANRTAEGAVVSDCVRQGAWTYAGIGGTVCESIRKSGADRHALIC
jgi:hypothetical protein